MIRARFLEPASVEFEEQIAFFDEQVSGLGDRFEEEVRFAVSLLIEHPKLGPSLSKRIRKLRLRTFRSTSSMRSKPKESSSSLSLRTVDALAIGAVASGRVANGCLTPRWNGLRPAALVGYLARASSGRKPLSSVR